MVGYEVHYQQQGGGQSGAPPVLGQGNTYIEIPSLNTGHWYDLWVKAVDYSNNKSDDSANGLMPGADPHRHDHPAARPPGAGLQRHLQHHRTR